MTRNVERDVSNDKKLDDLFALIDKIDTAMLTTIESDGSLAARPMTTLAAGADSAADLTFMTSTETGKVDTLQENARVNVSYLKETSREWVSVSGAASLSQDRTRIHALYQRSWKAWLGDRGGDLDGGPDDPRIVLIDVTADKVTYFKVDAPRPVVLFEVAKAMLTGEPPKVGEVRHIEGVSAPSDGSPMRSL